MARVPGSQAEIRTLEARALELEGEGVPLAEIAAAVKRSVKTVRRWLRKHGGRKKASKKRTILESYRKGHTIPEIIAFSGAAPRYVYKILEDREGKEERVLAEEKVEEFLEDGTWPAKDPRDTFGWCLLRRTSEIIDDDANKGLDLVADVAARYETEYRKRRVEYRKRAARCLETQFSNLLNGAYQIVECIDKARAASDKARRLHCGCRHCLAEIERQDGWLYSHIWRASEKDRDAAISTEHFGNALSIYRELYPGTGHHIHKNGIAGALHGCAVHCYYRGEHDAGLMDARHAVRCLDAKKSPGLVVPCTHTLAVYLAESGRPEHFAEALELLSGIRERMPEKGGVRYGKVLWLAGLLEDEGEGDLHDARDIFLEKGYRREVVAITTDLVAYHGRHREKQLEAVRTLGSWTQVGRDFASWLKAEFADLVEVWESLQAGVVSPELLARVRDGQGHDLPPNLLAVRR